MFTSSQPERPQGHTVIHMRNTLMTLFASLEALKNDKKADGNPVTQIAIGFILLAVALVIALAVYPLVADSVAAAQASTNVTGSQDTLLGLIPLILVVVLLAGALAFLVAGFRNLSHKFSE